MNYDRKLKNTMKQYGKHLKAAEKRGVLLSTWKQRGWVDYSELENRVEAINNGSN